MKLLAADERLLLAQALWAKVDAYLESRGRAELGAAWVRVGWGGGVID